MDRATLDEFRKQLEAMERELSAAVEGHAESTAPVALDTSIGRLSRMEAIQSQQMAIGLKARQQRALLRVRNALAAVAQGTYGLCRKCRKPMPIERLQAQPDAVFCVQCVPPIDR